MPSILKDFNYQCSLGLHPWGKWETLKSPANSTTVVQKRECPTCGKIQVRKAE